MPGQIFAFTVESTGERLDRLIVAHLPGVSRAQVQALIKDGLVMVNGQSIKAGVKLRGGETIAVALPEEPVAAVIIPEDIPLSVIYEDDTLAVIDKPAGLVTHPGVGNASGTLVHAMLARWPQIAKMNDADQRRGIVHRLDKDTSGLVVIAKNEDTLRRLMLQFQQREVEKTYLALLDRTPKTRFGRIDAPIGRDPHQRKKMTTISTGKAAVTEFTILDDHFRDAAALVEFHPLTGRTHQIRVHAAFIGCPVVGDRVYGFRKQRVKMHRIFLHAAKLVFNHPVTGERMSFESPLPSPLADILAQLR